MNTAEKIVMAVLDGLAILGALVGAWLIWSAINQETVMHTAGAATLGIAFTLVPYCLSTIAHRQITRRLADRG